MLLVTPQDSPSSERATIENVLLPPPEPRKRSGPWRQLLASAQAVVVGDTNACHEPVKSSPRGLLREVSDLRRPPSTSPTPSEGIKLAARRTRAQAALLTKTVISAALTHARRRRVENRTRRLQATFGHRAAAAATGVLGQAPCRGRVQDVCHTMCARAKSTTGFVAVLEGRCAIREGSHLLDCAGHRRHAFRTPRGGRTGLIRFAGHLTTGLLSANTF